MAKIPQQMKAQYAIFGQQHHSEQPVDADVTTHKLKHGDIVIFGTDGVWDNLSAQDTLVIVTKVMQEHKMWTTHDGVATKLNATGIRQLPLRIRENSKDQLLPGLIASAVMREAKLAGLDRKRNGPFAKEVKKYYPNEVWEGGKPDDIAVVVAIAIEDEAPAPKAKL